MSHGASFSPSQENRSSDHPLPLVSINVVNKQEMAFTSDTALKDLKASQNEVEFLNDELFRTSEQAEVDFRRLDNLRNVYENALEVQADKIFRLRNDLSSLQEDSQKQKASQDEISKELRKLKTRNDSLQKLNGTLQKRNHSLQDRNRSLEDNERLKGTGGLLPGRLSSPVGNNLEQFRVRQLPWDAAGQREDQESRIDTASQQKPVHPWVAQLKSLEDRAAGKKDRAASHAGKSKYLPMPEQVIGFWKPSSEDIPAVPQDPEDQ
jgi:hypothetical protein